jgi:hypothetical protein
MGRTEDDKLLAELKAAIAAEGADVAAAAERAKTTVNDAKEEEQS